jgi:hypothetical protein
MLLVGDSIRFQRTGITGKVVSIKPQVLFGPEDEDEDCEDCECEDEDDGEEEGDEDLLMISIKISPDDQGLCGIEQVDINEKDANNENLVKKI